MNACSFARILGLTLLTTLTTAGAALADEPAPDFRVQEATPAYTAPLSQTTQPSYVPQSVALSGPHELRYHEGEAAPPGYTPVQRTRKGPIIGGAILFGTLYMFSTLAAAASADQASHDGSSSYAALWLPAIGPFIQMAQTESGMGKYMLAVDGFGQVAGLALLVWGLTSPKTVLVRNDLTGAKVRVRPVPTASSRGAGLGLVATF
jgi:hypothetical protein